MEKIIIKGISKNFEGQKVLESIHLTVEPGTFFTLLGPSGCGKTTLLRILAGFEKPDEGSVYLGEKEITQIPAESRGVGMVFQNYALFPHLDVYENVAYGLKIKKLGKKVIQQRVTQYLQLVRLDGYEKRKVSELSGGEQQRVALARALVTQPEVLLLDEPLCNLDAKLRDEMREEIKSLQRKLGITTIFVTHDQKEALMMSDQIAVLHKGSCVQVGRPAKIYNQPQNVFVATFLGEMNILDIHQVDRLGLEREGITQGKWLAIRPEYVQMRILPEKGENEWEGRVKNIQFNGPVTEYLLDVQGITFKSIRLSHFETTPDVVVGQVVGVHLPKLALQILGV